MTPPYALRNEVKRVRVGASIGIGEADLSERIARPDAQIKIKNKKLCQTFFAKNQNIF